MVFVIKVPFYYVLTYFLFRTIQIEIIGVGRKLGSYVPPKTLNKSWRTRVFEQDTASSMI